MNKQMNTYLGQKGYTILKNELTVEQEKQIRNDLTIKPCTPGAPSTNDQKSFPAYRESGNKMYVPHYYGIDNYGIPKDYKISDGTNINLTFNGTLREVQETVVTSYLNHVNKVKYGGGLLELPCAFGKTILSLNIISCLNFIKSNEKAIYLIQKSDCRLNYHVPSWNYS